MPIITKSTFNNKQGTIVQDKIEDIAQGSYLLYLDRYADIQFHIGRIVK